MKHASYARLADVAPDLGAGLAGVESVGAWRRTLLPIVAVDSFDLGWQPRRASSGVGNLLVSGFVVREEATLGRTGSWLFGPGDVLPASDEKALFPWVAEGRWIPLTQLEVVFLDWEMAPVLLTPTVAARLVERRAPRSSEACVLQAIREIRGTTPRVLAFFWYLAERWGVRTRAGEVELPVPLRRDVLARLLGLGRPAASSAVAALGRFGYLRSHRWGWTLRGAPTDVELLVAGTRANSPLEVRAHCLTAPLAIMLERLGAWL